MILLIMMMIIGVDDAIIIVNNAQRILAIDSDVTLHYSLFQKKSGYSTSVEEYL